MVQTHKLSRWLPKDHLLVLYSSQRMKLHIQMVSPGQKWMPCVANHFRCTKWTSKSSWGRPATPSSTVILYVVGQDQTSFQPSSGPKDNFGKEWEGLGYAQPILKGYSLALRSALLLFGGSGDHSGCWGSIPDQTYMQGKHPIYCNNSPAQVFIYLTWVIINTLPDTI